MISAEYKEYAGHPSRGRRRIGVITPYFPYPLSHGGAIRTYNLLRETAGDFDIYLFTFSDPLPPEYLTPVLEVCSRVYIFPSPQYVARQRFSSLPPEVKEFQSHEIARTIARIRDHEGIELVQVECTYMGTYPGDLLVEHHVTWELYKQIYHRERTLSAWWSYWRWHKFETRALRRYRAVVVTSQSAAALLNAEHARVIPNGVDLAQFVPTDERAGQSILLVGSFSHYPNIAAYQFFVDEVWPGVLAKCPDAQLEVVCGHNAEFHWREFTGTAAPPAIPNQQLYGYVADVRPLYERANVVVVPAQLSTGTSLKVLEALAMERALVSTAWGCTEIGLEHGKSGWIADTGGDFAQAIALLLQDETLRRDIARNGRLYVEQRYGWEQIARQQKELWRELLPRPDIRIRRADAGDLGRVQQIEMQAHEAAHWDPQSYMDFDFHVACIGETVAGFMVSRRTADQEQEVLNIAVAPEFRRRGVAAALIHSLNSAEIFLEVRQSNVPARTLYAKLGFDEVGIRRGYYDDPPEDAVVMRWTRVSPA